MMNNITVSLLALKTFYENSKDSIDLYGDVVFSTIQNDDSKYSINNFQRRIKKYFEVEIPVDMIITIVKRLRKKNLVKYKKLTPDAMTIVLTEHGKIKKSEIVNNIKDIKRKESYLLKKLKNYLPDMTDETLRHELKLFIQNNPFIAATMMSGGVNNVVLKQSKHNQIKRFFEDTENNDPDGFEYLKSLLFGQIVASNLLNKQDKFSIKKVVFYIDTNVFLSLMGLHNEYENKSAQDAVNFIQKNGGEIKIFEHTKTELVHVLQNYLSQQFNYTKIIPVNSIYYTMKKKGYDSYKIKEIITNINQKISEFRINIEYGKNRLKNYEETLFKDDYYLELIRCKREKNKSEKTIVHDSYSIEVIRQKREFTANCYHFNSCKAVFLTSDMILIKFLKDKHQKNYLSIPEALTPEQITGMLWLHSVEFPAGTVFNNFLSGSVTNQTVELDIWEKFIQKLNSEKNKGNLTQNDIDDLLAQETTKEILFSGDEKNISTIILGDHIQTIRDKNRKAKTSEESKDTLIVDLHNTINDDIENRKKTSDAITNASRKEIDRKLCKISWIVDALLLALLLILAFIGYLYKDSFIGYLIIIGLGGAGLSWFKYARKALRLWLNNDRDEKITELVNKEKERLFIL